MRKYFEDIHAGDVVHLGSRQVTEEEVVAFARQFDPQPFHVDATLARDSHFGGLVASGWHTASMYMRLLVDGFLHEAASLGSPGLEELRWLKPVRPGDILQGRLTILETTPSRSRPTMGIVRSRGEAQNQDGDVVMSMVSTIFFARKAAEEERG
jgi:acyl dehydratase